MTGQNFSLTAHRIASPEKYFEGGIGYGIVGADLLIFHGSSTDLPETEGLPAKPGRLTCERFQAVDCAGRIKQSLSCQHGATSAVISCPQPYSYVTRRTRQERGGEL